MSGMIRIRAGVLGAMLACSGLAQALPATTPFLDVAQVAVGRAHSCALTTQGSVRCWGGNQAGQLGLGGVSELTVRPTPVPVPGLGTGNLALAAGDAHTCVITPARGVKCWGLNGAGAIGSGSGDYVVASPAAVVGLDAPVQAISAGSEHSCALLAGGRVKCWGNNAFGQLGDGSTSSRTTAVEVQGLPAAANRIDLGGEHSCASLGNGETRCWGYNEFGQLGDGSTSNRSQPVRVQGLPGPVSALAAGARASCAIAGAGTLFCWGAQYPLGAFDGGSTTARAYPGFENGFTAVDGGVFHFCAQNGNGAIKCLGDNADGQFGTGPLDGSLGAEFVVGLASDVTQFASGGWHNCARNARAGLQCWGLNTEGQLGIDAVSLRLVPTAVVGLDSGIASIAAGGFAGCALTIQGGVKCWGANGNGEVGDGSTQFRLTARDVVGLGSGVRAIDAGDGSACALTTQGGVKCWGANFDGRLGNGQTINSALPVDVQGLGGAASEVAVGRQHACAVVSGAARCWGSNEFGQLGDGSLQSRLSATAVSGLGANVRSIATGYYHSCAVVGTGIKCWGVNSSGQLGNGSRSNSATPVDVSGLGGPALAVSAGIVHTCALLQGGRVQCWGGSGFGSLLGDGSTEDRLVPGDVPALASGVVQISLGSFHSCARRGNGSMLCWGQGGTIGDNTQVGRGTPTPVAGLGSGVQAISAGFGTQSCAVVNGAARCWGDNTFGQLGDGTTHGVPTAQVVLVNELVRRVVAVTADANAASRAGILDGSGRFLLFESEADNLVAGDSNGARDVFIRDRETKAVRRISVDDAGAQIAGASQVAGLSANARLALFTAPDSAVGALRGEGKAAREARRKSSHTSILLRNLLTGTTQAVATGVQSTSSSTPPQLSAEGTAVVYTATTTDASEGEVGQDNVYVVPLTVTGSSIDIGSARCISCKSVAGDGTATSANSNGDSEAPVISADGSVVAFATESSNLLAGTSSPCPNSGGEIVLSNLITGSVQRISTPSGGSCGTGSSSKPSIDYSGTVVAFASSEPLQAGDANAANDVYVWTAASGSVERVSEAAGGGDGNGESVAPIVSGNGKTVAFVSSASNLDTGFADNNDRSDVHAANLEGDVVRLSRSASGAEVDADSATPSLSFDGSQVAFDSAAAALAGTAVGRSVVYARSNPLSEPNRSATWWIASESGWGLTVFDQGSVLAPTWFTYDYDGEPTWFIVGGAVAQADGSFKGDLYRFTGTRYDQIQGSAALTADVAGSVDLRYLGERTLQFGYRVDNVQQSKVLQRFPFGSRGFSCSESPEPSRAQAQNYTDLWTGSGPDAGWGLTLFHVDEAIFAIWYTYDLDGEAVFFVVSTTRQADGSFAGDVFRQRNGTPFAQIDGGLPSPDADVIGSARFQFSDGENASFGYTINGLSQTKSINRLLVGDRASVCRTEDLMEE